MRRLFLALIVILLGCSSNEITNTNLITTDDEHLENVWCVEAKDVTGGSDSFLTMDNPKYNSVVEIESINFLNDNSKLALLKIKNQLYVYPYDYTNYYEIINDSFGEDYLAISYCPLTESVLCFNRKISPNEIITIKASGFLYKDNLVPSDINFNYYWSQMLTTSIRGDNKELRLRTYNIIETTWKIVKDYFPDAMVFSHSNINNCNCDETPTPINYNNLFGVIHEHVQKGDITHLFNYNNFANGIQIDHLSVNGKNTVVVGSKEKVFFNAFYVPGSLNFDALDESEFPNILYDNEGNKWDIFGHAVEGPRLGDKLDSPKAYVAAEWAWNNFFKNITLHN